MLTKPAVLNYFLSNHGLINGIYAAMAKDDTAELVMITLDALKKINYITPLIKTVKMETTSTDFRNEGNRAYKAGNYQTAFDLYCKALLHAPNESLAMKLAYSNRSALLLKLKEFSSCLRDLEICISMGCPVDIVEKVKKRKEEALRLVWMERLAQDVVTSPLCKAFFELNTSRNPQIPCASTAVGIIMEDQVPKVVATTDIKVGTVVAVEKAFVSQAMPQYSCCHHCQKFTLNLIPCNNCCFALFCDKDCMESCINEYHSVECQIIDIYQMDFIDLPTVLAVQATLKIRKMCNSWKEIITVSQNIGLNRMRDSSINDIFDVDRMFSLLSFRDDKHFVYGAMYTASFICAAVIDSLDRIQTFFPHCPDEKKEAMKAIARILMFLKIYATHTKINPAVSISSQGLTEVINTSICGWFSFTGKLKHACNPNLYVTGLNGAVGLIAIQPIKCGTELTISYMTHYLDVPFDKSMRKLQMMQLYGILCNCYICSGQWEMNKEYPLNEVQNRNLRKLNLDRISGIFSALEVPGIYQKLCKSLALLQDVPYSKEYKEVYEIIMKCMLTLQRANYDNKIIDCVVDG